MRTRHKFLLAMAAVAAAALGWGYWHAHTHASVTVRVEDYGLKTNKVAYGTPHDVTVRLLSPAGEELAVARSVEPLGYITAIHPSHDIGNCEHRGIGATAADGRVPQGDYQSCYAVYSAWAAQWAPRVRRAHVQVGTCAVRDLPVIHSSSGDWWMWWVPLPHVGGVPRRDFEFVVRIDSKVCAPAGR